MGLERLRDVGREKVGSEKGVPVPKSHSNKRIGECGLVSLIFRTIVRGIIVQFIQKFSICFCLFVFCQHYGEK